MKNKKIILISAVNALLLILISVCLLRISGYGRLLLSQQAADYWAGDSDERFAQVSYFFPVDKPTSTDSIMAFRKTIDSKLADVGIEAKEDGEYWADAYSATGSLTVEGDRNSAEATAIGVGGDYFLFHPYELLSGSFISADDLMKDRVVLDYELAWNLFGGDQLEGMTVTINGKPYYVAGVVRRETDKFSKKAFEGEPAIFMPYETLNSLTGGTDGGTSTGMSSGAGIDCYEIVMPDPISDFARTFVDDSFKSSEGLAVENSTRYDFSSIFELFRDFGNRSIVDKGMIFPYWENAARISEVYVARLYVFILLLSLFPLLCLAVLTVRLVKYLIKKAKLAKFKLTDAWDDRYAREAVWKERRANKRIEKNLRKHERRASPKNAPKKLTDKLTVKLPERPLKKPRKKLLKRPAKSAPAVNVPPERPDSFEREIVPDIESIVREVMEEIHSADTEK